MLKKIEIRRSILNYLISFVLLYVTVFIAIFAMNSLKKMGSERFLFVSLAQKEQGMEDKNCVSVRRENSIRIQKINVDAPLIFPAPGTEDLLDDLDRGVTHYPESDLPGEVGAAMFLGHSAPPGWPDIRFDKVFVDIEKLEPGDEIEIYYENCRYNYEVTEKEVLDKGEEVPDRLTKDKKTSIMLISCWPPSTGTRRMVVVAELLAPRGFDF